MLKFRPHHFLCALGFRGKGYSREFVMNFERIMSALLAPGGDGSVIEVASHTDSICEPCPSRTAEICASELKINQLDTAHARVLGLTPGMRLTWGEAKQRLAERMSLEQFEQSCAPCAWRSLGYCRSALLSLHEQRKDQRQDHKKKN